MIVANAPVAGIAPRIHAVVLAADRTAADAVARHAHTACKAAAPARGVPMLSRVLGTLRSVPAIGRIIVVGPSRHCLESHPGLEKSLATAGATRLEPEISPSRSALRGVQEARGEFPLLLTTADHALLTAPMLGKFLGSALAAGADLAVGLVPYSVVAAAFPGVRRTVLRFGPGYCTCNLFACLTPAGSRVIETWVKVERQRKHPARLVLGILGVSGLLRYLLGTLSLEDALARAARRLGATIVPVFLEEPEASVDVDTPDDLRRVEEILARREGTSPSP